MFFVFRYFKQFSTHEISNVSIYKYIYIITTVLRPPCCCYGGGSFTQKDRKSINRVYPHVLLFCDILSSSVLTQPRNSLYIGGYIYIITAVLQPPCWSYGGGSFTQKNKEFNNRVNLFFCFALL